MRLPSPRTRRGNELPSLEGAEDSFEIPDADGDDDEKKEVALKIGWTKLMALNKPEASFICFGCVASLLTGARQVYV